MDQESASFMFNYDDLKMFKIVKILQVKGLCRSFQVGKRGAGIDIFLEEFSMVMSIMQTVKKVCLCLFTSS